MILHAQHNSDVLMLPLNQNNNNYHNLHQNNTINHDVSYLYDILFKRLMIEKSTNDYITTECLQNISYIICNSLLTENNKVR